MTIIAKYSAGIQARRAMGHLRPRSGCFTEYATTVTSYSQIRRQGSD